MPTFNQLVRKGREQATYKSTSPALQFGLNTLKNKSTDLPSPQKRGAGDFCFMEISNVHNLVCAFGPITFWK